MIGKYYTLKDVKKLRDLSGCNYDMCVMALDEWCGNIYIAKEWLRRLATSNPQSLKKWENETRIKIGLQGENQ